MLAASVATIATGALPSWRLEDMQERTERVKVPGTLVRRIDVQISPQARAEVTSVGVRYGTKRDASCNESPRTGPRVAVDQEGLPVDVPRPARADLCSQSNFQRVELSRVCPNQDASCGFSFDLLIRATEGSGAADVTWFVGASTEGDGDSAPAGATLVVVAPPDPGRPKEPPAWKAD